MTTYIYGLVDPRDRTIRYIGQTEDMDRRLQQHLADRSKTSKTAWIAELRGLDLQPIMIQLDRVDCGRVQDVEYRWVYLGRQRGWPLTNTTAMKTTKYSGMAETVDGTVFVESMPTFSIKVAWRYMKDIFWNDDAWLEYYHIRTGFILLSLIVLAVGTLLSGVSNVVLTMNADSFFFQQTFKLGEVITIAASLVVIHIALPRYINHWVEVILYAKNSIMELAWLLFMGYKTGYYLDPTKRHQEPPPPTPLAG